MSEPIISPLAVYLKNNGEEKMTIKELYRYALNNCIENLPFRYGYVDDDGVYRPHDFDFADFEYDAEEVTMLFSEDALKALADKMLEEVTMNYAGIEEGFEVYRCSRCQADVYHTIYWYDYCPGCGRKIKEWK